MAESSKNQNDSNFKLTWSELVETMSVIKICSSKSKRRSSFQQTRSKVSLKVSLITLTKKFMSLIIYFNSITQSCYMQYKSNNVSNS